MGKIEIVLQGKDADMQRLYDHLAYHVKEIEPSYTEIFIDHKKSRKFWVVI